MRITMLIQPGRAEAGGEDGVIMITGALRAALVFSGPYSDIITQWIANGPVKN